MTPTQIEKIEQEAQAQANLHVHKDLNYNRWWTGVACYKAGRIKSDEEKNSRIKELEEGLRKIKVHFGDGASRNPYVKPVIEAIYNLLNNK